jgi:hypothetical protein
MKKAIWVLNIGNYRPDITKYTLPTIKAYAEKIGAEYHEITERKFPDFPVTYEKMQLWELGKGYDWNVLVDADVLISQALTDITEMVPANYVGAHGSYDISITVKEPDNYFARDGRQKGVATYFVATSWLTHDLWEPLDMTAEEALSKMKREFVVDEFCASRNLAKYGLKLTGVCKEPALIHHLSLTTENGDVEEGAIQSWLDMDSMRVIK